MKIKCISITNVKSFNTTTNIEFDPSFNIIIGPNASGKSNLLDIITIVLKKFFLWSYIKNSEGGSSNRFNLTTDNSFSDLSIHLDRHLGSSDPSEIEITFIVKSEDLHNLKICKEKKNDLLGILNSETYRSEGIINTFQSTNWDESLFKRDDLVKYRIVNNQLKLNQNAVIPKEGDSDNLFENYKALVFLRYLNYHHLFTLYQDRLLIKEFKPCFLMLSPYRAISSDQDFLGNLSQNNSATIAVGLQHTTSKQQTSLIRLATTYFSEKLRGFESEARQEGYEAIWEKDPEVLVVSDYLRRLGYQWCLKLVNSNQNVYQIELEKQGHKLLLSQASSGEKEIINYLFGIFALKISNGIIIIDEPELHLHPRWQLLLMDLFKELTFKTGNQFIITTHSGVFINENSVSNLIRIFQKNYESKHVAFKFSVKLKDLLHLVNSTNNEKVFFADLVILVEGVTDRLVFQKIVASVIAKKNVLSVVEVVDINGKGNIKKFRKYLRMLEIPYYFIADLDYINQVGTSQVKGLFVTDLGAVDGNAIKNSNSTDGKKLIEILDEAVATGDVKAIAEFSAYMKSFRTKLKDNLTGKEKELLDAFIKNRQSEKEFILSKGVIENYFPKDYKTKDLENVIDLLKEPEFSNWKTKPDYLLLENIINTIIDNAKLN